MKARSHAVPRPVVSAYPNADRLCDYIASFGRAYLRADQVVNGQRSGSSKRAEQDLRDAARSALRAALGREPNDAEVERAVQP